MLEAIVDLLRDVVLADGVLHSEDEPIVLVGKFDARVVFQWTRVYEES